MNIGIVGQESEGIWGVKANYMAWASQFGKPVVLFPTDWDNFQKVYSLDALILPGGADIASHRYAWFPHPWAGDSNPFLESFDHHILPNLIGKMPIFGICRGLQTLNVVLGGTLYQHLWTHPYSAYEQDIVHEITARGEKKKIPVNSFHHQAVNKLGKGVVIEATSKDGVIEAISHTDLPIFAVQWHPERLGDEYSRKHMEKILS